MQSDSNIARFSFTGTDTGGTGISSFECSLDSAPWTVCSSPVDYTGLVDGKHTFDVRAKDAADNPDTTPAHHDWEVDTSGPPIKPSPPTPPTQPTPPATGQAQFVRVVSNTKTGNTFLLFEVTGAGRFSTRAATVTEITRGSHKSEAHAAARIRELRLRQKGIRPASTSVAEAGDVKVPLKLTATGKRLLRNDHELKVRIHVSFVSLNGSTTIWKVNVTLKKRTANTGKPPKFGPRRGR